MLFIVDYIGHSVCIFGVFFLGQNHSWKLLNYGTRKKSSVVFRLEPRWKSLLLDKIGKEWSRSIPVGNDFEFRVWLKYHCVTANMKNLNQMNSIKTIEDIGHCIKRPCIDFCLNIIFTEKEKRNKEREKKSDGFENELFVIWLCAAHLVWRSASGRFNVKCVHYGI